MKPLQRFLKPQDIEIIFINIEVSWLMPSGPGPLSSGDNLLAPLVPALWGLGIEHHSGEWMCPQALAPALIPPSK